MLHRPRFFRLSPSPFPSPSLTSYHTTLPNCTVRFGTYPNPNHTTELYRYQEVGIYLNMEP